MFTLLRKQNTISLHHCQAEHTTKPLSLPRRWEQMMSKIFYYFGRLLFDVALKKTQLFSNDCAAVEIHFKTGSALFYPRWYMNFKAQVKKKEKWHFNSWKYTKEDMQSTKKELNQHNQVPNTPAEEERKSSLDRFVSFQWDFLHCGDFAHQELVFFFNAICFCQSF